MAFYTRDDPASQAQQAREERAAAALTSDPDIRNAMRGVFTGKYADLARTLPVAWAPQTRNDVVARAIARDKHIDTSGVRWNGREWESANPGVPLAVELAPYIISGVAGGLAAAPAAAGTGATTAGTGVGLGETAATTGLASGAGLPGAVAIPTVADLAGTGSAIANVGASGNALADIASTGEGGGAGGGVPSWLTGGKGALVSTAANVFGNVYAANKQAGASEEALQQQQAQFDEALKDLREERAYNRNQYGDYLGRLQPYLATGDQANDRLAQYMGTPSASGGTHVTPASTAALRQPPVTAPTNPTPTPTTTPPTSAAGTPVRMRAPDGTEQDVPADQVAHYQQLGATVIGNRYTTMGAG